MIESAYIEGGSEEYVVSHGQEIDDIKIEKKALLQPGRSYSIVDMPDVRDTIKVHAQTRDHKIWISFDVDFFASPKFNSEAGLVNYFKLIASRDDPPKSAKQLVHGIVERVAKDLAGSIIIKSISSGFVHIHFIGLVLMKAKLELGELGLDIKFVLPRGLHFEARDDEYISNLMEAEAANQPKIDVAKEIYAETSNITSAEDADLEKKKIAWAKKVQLAKVEADKEVEMINFFKEMDKLTAHSLCQFNLDYEAKVLEANGDLYQKQKLAEAYLYQAEKEAAAQKAAADAASYVQEKIVNGDLFAKKKEAEGLITFAEAQGIYVRTLLDAFGGNYYAMRDYLMIIGGMYQGTAKINAEAAARGMFYLVWFCFFICILVMFRK